jgi:co-chaperonin GroES (HSP10)
MEGNDRIDKLNSSWSRVIGTKRISMLGKRIVVKIPDELITKQGIFLPKNTVRSTMTGEIFLVGKELTDRSVENLARIAQLKEEYRAHLRDGKEEEAEACLNELMERTQRPDPDFYLGRQVIITNYMGFRVDLENEYSELVSVELPDIIGFVESVESGEVKGAAHGA